MSLVSQAKKAFADENYHYALELYQKAGQLLGHKFFGANIALCKKRCDAKQGILNKLGNSRATHDSKGLLYADQFKVALIADEFTTNSFSDEFQAVAIEPDNWQELFEKHQPDIFFANQHGQGPTPSNALGREEFTRAKTLLKKTGLHYFLSSSTAGQKAFRLFSGIKKTQLTIPTKCMIL